MFATGRRKILHLEEPFRLFLKRPHQFRKGKTIFVATLLRIAAEIADRLEMDAAYDRNQLQCLPDYGSDGVGVYPFYKGRNEDNAETCLSGILDGLEFPGKKCSSPQGVVNLIVDPVELEKNRRKPCRPESFCVAGICGKTQTVRIELDEGKTDPSRHCNDLREVVPQGRFPPGQLEIAGAGGGHGTLQQPRNLLQRRVLCFLTAGIGKADGTVEVAPSGHFEQDRTGNLLVSATEAAVKRTPFFNSSITDGGMHRNLRSSPFGHGRFAAP
jgi:hypothetical protein